MAASTMSTSFQRRPKAGSQNIPGTKFSSTTSSLLVSSGIPGLDAIIDGGLPLGSLCVIEEDQYGSYSKILMKCFLAEGIVHKNHIFAASCDENPVDIIKNLPSSVPDNESLKTKTENIKDELKIAWRYENLSVSGDVTKQQNHFDLSQPIAFESLLHENITLWDGLSVQTATANGSLRNARCRDLLTKVYKELEQRKLLTDNKTSPNLMRISIFSLGSPLWDFAEDLKDLTATLVILKSLLRAANTVGLVTIPAVVSPHVIDRCFHIADVAVRMKTLQRDKELKSMSIDYHGVLEIKKITNFSSLKSAASLTVASSYGFKAMKKKFIIEKLHLPPALEEKTESIREAGPSCSSKDSKLDF